jgi:hypothetical protein
MRVKRNRHASSTKPARPLDGALQNFAMPKVHPVKHADGNNGPPAIRAKSRSPFLRRM